ncbi:MAG: hypothetical protein WBF53_17060 [Litorimonas sp.]
MRRTTLALATTALLLAPLSASAKSRGFDSTVAAPVQTPVSIEVVLSEDLAHRADNLPRDIAKRGGGIRSRSGFSGNGFYGQRDLDRLLEEVREELTEDFAKRGIAISEDAPTVLKVTLEDVKNNRPTFEQLSREPGLSFQSFGIGGAELSAEVLGADGQSEGSLRYRWFETFQDPGFLRANGTWTDANRAISRFSRHAAKELSPTS